MIPSRPGSLCAVCMVFLVVVVVVLGGCSSFPEKTSAYLPATVGKRKVDTKSDLVQKVTDSFKQDSTSLTDVVGGTVGDNCQDVQGFPDLQLAAMRAKAKNGLAESDLDALAKQLGAAPSVKPSTQTIDGIKVRTFVVSPGGDADAVAISYASPLPKKGVILYSIAYCGGQKQAVDGIRAMLDAGNR